MQFPMIDKFFIGIKIKLPLDKPENKGYISYIRKKQTPPKGGRQRFPNKL